jgi:hypothetical protein
MSSNNPKGNVDPSEKPGVDPSENSLSVDPSEQPSEVDPSEVDPSEVDPSEQPGGGSQFLRGGSSQGSKGDGPNE